MRSQKFDLTVQIRFQTFVMAQRSVGLRNLELRLGVQELSQFEMAEPGSVFTDY